jgi:ATP-dependent DNA helicase RecQ
MVSWTCRTLRRLDEFARGAEFLLGHNLICFDVSHLEAANLELRLLELPRVSRAGSLQRRRV